MSKTAEKNYLKANGPGYVDLLAKKPFPFPTCGKLLVEIGMVMQCMPEPPARLLDLGCGMGWTSLFFARRGYDVVGADIADDMIFHAQRLAREEGLDNLSFIASDYENLQFREEFDIAVFFDSLHHAIDEKLALQKAAAALRPGGVLITSEPGEGHASNPDTVHAVNRYGVTEKDMPPYKIKHISTGFGLTVAKILPHDAFDLVSLLATPAELPRVPWSLKSNIRRWLCKRFHVAPARELSIERWSGITVLRKPLTASSAHPKAA